MSIVDVQSNDFCHPHDFRKQRDQWLRMVLDENGLLREAFIGELDDLRGLYFSSQNTNAAEPLLSKFRPLLLCLLLALKYCPFSRCLIRLSQSCRSLFRFYRWSTGEFGAAVNLLLTKMTIRERFSPPLQVEIMRHMFCLNTDRVHVIVMNRDLVKSWEIHDCQRIFCVYWEKEEKPSKTNSWTFLWRKTKARRHEWRVW
jgi:hypothetical protein